MKYSSHIKYALRYSLMFLVMCLCINCGSKKKLSEKVKQEVKHNNDIILTQQNDIVSNTKIRKTRKEIIYEPINPDKSIKINDSTVVQNAKVTFREVQEESEKELEDNSKTDFKDNSKTEITLKEKSQDKEVKHRNQWWIIGIVGLLGFVLYHKVRGRRIF